MSAELQTENNNLRAENTALDSRVRVLQVTLRAKQRELDLLKARYEAAQPALKMYAVMHEAVDEVVTVTIAGADGAAA